jgi:putative tryptophan/tyrosine transport system substrate-binding protein
MMRRLSLDGAKRLLQRHTLEEHEKPQLHRRQIRRRGAPPAARIAMMAAVVLVTAALPSWAQQVPHILVAGPTNLSEITTRFFIAGLWEGLKSGGYPGDRIRIDLKNAVSEDEAKAVIGPAIDTGVDAIVTIYGQATHAASAATTKIPIVFCPVADAVASKYAASNEAPGGNLTGVSSGDAEASRRRLEAFHRLLPGLKRLAVLFDPGFPPDKAQMRSLEQVAPSTGIALVLRPVADEGAAIAALRDLGAGQADAIFILKESQLRTVGAGLRSAAMQQKLPILVSDRDLALLPFVLASVGPNQRELGRSCGRLTAQILAGARPAALPIEHPVFESVLNPRTAQRLGIAVPEAALTQANAAMP